MSEIKSYLNNLFADRQLYIRSQGNVRFISLSRRTLLAMSGLLVAATAWVGVASYHMVFQDDIAAQREQAVHAQQRAYESQIAQLQLAYDDVNARLALTTDWFNETTNNLEKRHDELNQVFEQHARISSNLRDMQETFASIAKRNQRNRNKTELVGRSGQVGDMLIESRTTTPPTSDDDVQLSQFATPQTSERQTLSDVLPQIHARIDSLSTRQSDLLDALEESIDVKVEQFEELIAETDSIDTDSFMARILDADERATGGPYIPLDDKTNRNKRLHQQLYRISNNLDRLEKLSKSVAELPFALPIHDYRITSGFGGRVDPFTKRAAFHSGVDFGAARGTPVYATLPGTVVRAGNKGPYGLVVEIDHGNGFRTRYGHLDKSHVTRGQYVEFQQRIADAGNSGRSTGSHLHYEIWFDGKVRDPSAFLNAGKQIFNIAEAIESNSQ